MEKYRDLFTEKDTTQMSLFHKDNIQTYKKKINRDLYDQFYGPVKNIESDYLNTLNVVEKQEIPYHRVASVRLSVFLTFAYFGFRYLFFQSEKLFPIQFLDIYIKSLTICGFFVFYTSQVEIREYYFVLFFFMLTIILHFASRNKIRSYFN